MDELDPDFEPQDRPRSCTWPSLRRPDFLDKKPSQPAGDNQAQGAQQTPVPEEHIPIQPVLSPQIPTENKVDLTTPSSQRKNGSRRNAWGNLSYADLITKAIQGAPEQRLTLAQIYEWMVKNVPFFKDKGDSNSSAGWKNSIRHNLSLHSRFVRVQNEGTGKSSWWMINPDAKPGKSSRRRSSSMDGNNAKWDKKRGRAKKKAEEKAKTYANSSPKLEGADDQNSLPFSLGDFRSRTSSNASSCGRLSPILAHDDIADMHDREAPPMSPIPYADHIEPSHHFDTDSSHPVELASLASLSLNHGMNSPLHVDHMDQLPVPSNFQANGGVGHYHNGGGSNGNGYSIYSPQSSTYSNSELSPGQNGVQSPYSSYSQPATPAMSPLSQQRQCSPINGDINTQFIPLLSQSASILSQDALLSRQSSHGGGMMQAVHSQAVQPSCREESNTRSPSTSLHRYLPLGQHQLNARVLPSPMDGGNTSLHPCQHHASIMVTGMHHHHHGGMGGAIPNDLNNLEISGGDFDYDYDSFLRNEMAQGEGFSNVSFENINTGNSAPPASMGTNWVH